MIFCFIVFLIQDSFSFVDKLKNHTEKLVFNNKQDGNEKFENNEKSTNAWNVFYSTFLLNWTVDREVLRINERQPWENKIYLNVQKEITCPSFIYISIS